MMEIISLNAIKEPIPIRTRRADMMVVVAIDFTGIEVSVFT